ncbi:MAG TPA: type II toxin-antitoxin system PemK/MazF family toxin [Candidatus Paceibacterota bacterium]
MNEYDLWNKVKKDLESVDQKVERFPQEGEVWISILGKNIGFEQHGSREDFSRPVLVLKKFNNHMFWCIPLTTKQKEYDFYFNYIDPDSQKVAAILAQMKLMSIKRLQRKLYLFNNRDFGVIKSRIRYLIQ